MAILAHPDDESLGFGGTLAKYAAAGVEVHLLTATRGEAGRYGEFRPTDAGHPGRDKLAGIREAELRAAARTLGIKTISLLDYQDAKLDQADPREAIRQIADHVRRIRPDVVLTFGPDGAYGHPDHIAISQFTSAALVAAASERSPDSGEFPHAVSKLYYLAWPASTWAAYESAFKTLVSMVDSVERHAVPWPDWSLTTHIDTRDMSAVVWQAVSCHVSQISNYARLQHLSTEHHEALWGQQSFYRVFSTVNGGRRRETDLFEGLQ
jgi:LmbE family N-acetylglucosaminyl deacetylase